LSFFAVVAGTGEDGVDEVGIVDVDFVWVDSNYGTYPLTLGETGRKEGRREGTYRIGRAFSRLPRCIVHGK
jgi:hypothetical protein